MNFKLKYFKKNYRQLILLNVCLYVVLSIKHTFVKSVLYLITYNNCLVQIVHNKKTVNTTLKFINYRLIIT